MTNEEIERIAIHAEAACKCSFDDVGPVFAIRELQSRVEGLQAERDTAVMALRDIAVLAVSYRLANEPIENLPIESIAAAAIRACSNKEPGK